MPPTPKAPKPDGLQAKLAAVYGDMERVKKSGRNTQQGYDFAREGDIVDMVRASLAEHRVTLSATIRQVERIPITSKGGGSGTLAIVGLDLVLTCADTGETEQAYWEGDATDYTDKALPKAITACKKSYLVFRFLVSTGDLEEADASGIERASQQQQAPPTQASAPRPNPADSRKATQPQLARIFAIAAKHHVDAKFATRYLTRTTDQPRGLAASDLTQAQARYVADHLEAFGRAAEPETLAWLEKLGKWSARLVEVEDAEREKERQQAAEASPDAAAGSPANGVESPQEAGTPPPGEDPEGERTPSCTCGVGDDELASSKHAASCSMSIPF